MSSLFSVCNAFHLGAYQVAINEASELTELSATEQVEKDCYAYRSYVALGSYQVRIIIIIIALFFYLLSLSLFGFSLFFLCVLRGGVARREGTVLRGSTARRRRRRRRRRRSARFDGALKSPEKLK